MADLAGWVALAATCFAAVMTASNLGARVTGWGFVVFTIGAIAWIVVGISTQQTQLLWSNIFLAVVDVFGIWRWLGRRVRFSDAAEAAQSRSKAGTGDDLFALSGVEGMPVKNADGTVLGHAVDVMASCANGGLDYLIIREGGMGGVGETLRKLAWTKVRVHDRSLITKLDGLALAKLPIAEPS